MTSGQNNIIVSEIGFCALDVSRAPDCLGHAEAPDGTRAAALLTETLDVALPYRDAGWLRALIVYARADGGWSMQTPQEGSPRRVKHSMRSQISTARHGRACPRPNLWGTGIWASDPPRQRLAIGATMGGCPPRCT